MAWVGKAPMVAKLSMGVAGKATGTGPARFAEYIGTRVGVERAAEEPVADPTIQAAYVAERPGSTGLFGPDPAAPPELAEVQAAVGAAPWWHAWVVTMRGPDAEQAGLRTPQDWRAMVRRAMPQIAEEQHVPGSAVRWVAAVHHKVGKDGVPQPHVHVLVWPTGARAPKMPRLRREELRAAKKVWAREVFGAERVGLAVRKTAQRDLVLRGAATLARGEPGLAAADAAELARRLAALAALLPTRGKMSLGFMPAPVRREATALAEWLLRRAPLAAGAAGRVSRPKRGSPSAAPFPFSRRPRSPRP